MPTFPLEPGCLENWLYHAVREVVQVKRPANCIGVEGTFGSGWVILSGVHPEAPERWRHGMTFATPGSEANACAGMLVRAALNRLSISHY
jgi:hypothetical protein